MCKYNTEHTFFKPVWKSYVLTRIFLFILHTPPPNYKCIYTLIEHPTSVPSSKLLNFILRWSNKKNITCFGNFPFPMWEAAATAASSSVWLNYVERKKKFTKHFRYFLCTKSTTARPHPYFCSIYIIKCLHA